MKYNIKNTLRAGALAVVGVLAFASCSDTWDDHYEGSTSSLGESYSGTTMGYLQSQPNLSDFVAVLKAAGYESELNDPQVLTVLAPVNGTFNKDSLLSLISTGKKKNVVNRFVKNHLMRYNISLGNKAQSVYLLNDKIVNVGTLADNTIQNRSLSKVNVGCTNGIVHVMGEDLPYQPNLFEFIEDDWDAFKATLDPGVNPDTIISLYNYLYKFNTDSLDEHRSVSRGVDLETGNTIYVDSVMIRNNKALAQLGAFLYREDSTYLAILPSLQAYQQRYEEAKKYFNFNVSFNSEESVRDSIQNYYANYFTVCDLFYNMSESMNKKTQNDSLFSTVYSRRTWEYNKYLKPYSAEGILGNYLGKYTCSNGTMYKMNDIPYTKYTISSRRLLWRQRKPVTLRQEPTGPINRQPVSRFEVHLPTVSVVVVWLFSQLPAQLVIRNSLIKFLTHCLESTTFTFVSSLTRLMAPTPLMSIFLPSSVQLSSSAARRVLCQHRQPIASVLLMALVTSSLTLTSSTRFILAPMSLPIATTAPPLAFISSSPAT